MTRESIAGLAGLLVLVAGVVAATATIVRGGPAEQADAVVTVATTTTVATPEQQTLPELPGVPEAVTRALYTTGNAEAVSPDELAGVPPEVARVLVAYQTPLLVPEVEPEKPSG